jgi:hypothetical protein
MCVINNSTVAVVNVEDNIEHAFETLWPPSMAEIVSKATICLNTRVLILIFSKLPVGPPVTRSSRHVSRGMPIA